MSSRYHRFQPWRNEFYASVNFRAANIPRNFRIRSERWELRVKLACHESRFTNAMPGAARAHAVKMITAKFDLPRAGGYDRRT
jgi:hypothetical protein